MFLKRCMIIWWLFKWYEEKIQVLYPRNFGCLQGFFSPKTEVPENSLSEPFKDIFTNHFKTVYFCTYYWDWHLIFHPSWCPCWKALIWCMGECSSIPYLVLLNQKQNYHKKKVLKSLKLIWRLWDVTSATHIRNIRQYCRILRYTLSFLTISCLLCDLKVYYHA